MPPAESEVIPGVKWGLPEWVPSAAYWAAMIDLSDDPEDYVCLDATLKEQVGFCLLGGYGVTAEMNHAAYEKLDAAGIFAIGGTPSSDEIRAVLRERITVKGKLVSYRFPNQRAERLAQAMRMLEESSFPSHNPLQFRRDLMKIPGIGPKTASWITRNWLGSDEVAILDIHIVRAGLLIGLFKQTQVLPRDYEVMELRFLEFARALHVRPSLLDAVIWRSMRKLRRGPI